jgi:hypothetical protein
MKNINFVINFLGSHGGRWSVAWLLLVSRLVVGEYFDVSEDRIASIFRLTESCSGACWSSGKKRICRFYGNFGRNWFNQSYGVWKTDWASTEPMGFWFQEWPFEGQQWEMRRWIDVSCDLENGPLQSLRLEMCRWEYSYGNMLRLFWPWRRSAAFFRSGAE